MRRTSDALVVSGGRRGPRIRSLERGDREVKAVAAGARGGYADFSVVTRYECAADRQAESGAGDATLMSPSSVGLEDALAVLFRDRRSAACDRNPPVSPFSARFDPDLALAARPVAQRVHEEIRHYAPEHDPVTVNHGQISGDDAGATSADFAVEQLDAGSDEPLEVDGCSLERLAVGARIKEEGFGQETHAG
jgi:hypothetical protein